MMTNLYLFVNYYYFFNFILIPTVLTICGGYKQGYNQPVAWLHVRVVNGHLLLVLLLLLLLLLTVVVVVSSSITNLPITDYRCSVSLMLFSLDPGIYRY